MFISVKQGLFHPRVEQEINNAINAVDNKIDTAEIPSIDETVKTKKIAIQNTSSNWSIAIGNQIVLFFKVAAGINSLTIPKNVAPLSTITVRALDVGDEIYCSATVNNDGLVTITDHDREVVVYLTYILAKGIF